MCLDPQYYGTETDPVNFFAKNDDTSEAGSFKVGWAVYREGADDQGDDYNRLFDRAEQMRGGGGANSTPKRRRR